MGQIGLKNWAPAAYFSVLNNKAVVDTRFQHFQHLGILVLRVIADVLQDIMVGNNAQRTEDYPHWDVNLDVRNCRLHDTSRLKSLEYKLSRRRRDNLLSYPSREHTS